MKGTVREIAQLHNAQAVHRLGPGPNIQEEHPEKGEAKVDPIQGDPEILGTMPSLLRVELADKVWERELLQQRKRDSIRVGRDGNDVFVKAPFSEERYVNLAREILHRFRPNDDMLPGDAASDCDDEVEFTPDFNLHFLLLLGGTHARREDPYVVSSQHLINLPHQFPEHHAVSLYYQFRRRFRVNTSQFQAAAWYISRSLLVDREETFRCIAAHPWYQKKEKLQIHIKQELVFFFDKRFTYQMGQFYGIDETFLHVDEPVLRLGSDSAFCEDTLDCKKADCKEDDALDCGGAAQTAIVSANWDAWASFVEEITLAKRETGETPQVMAFKRSEHISETRESEYNATSQVDLTPKPTTKRVGRLTQSEISEFTILTKNTLGPEALVQVTESALSDGPRTPGYEADRSDTEVDAYGQSKNGNSPVDSEMVDRSGASDVLST
jgi:hypothetical protein